MTRPAFFSNSNIEDVTKIGNFIKEIRLKLNLTQEEVSSKTGFSVQTISKFENGHCGPRTYASVKIVNYVLDAADIDDEKAIELYSIFYREQKDFSDSIMDS